MTAAEYQKKSKESKYKNIKIEFDGIKFDSKMECEYYQFLLSQGIKKSDIYFHPEYILFNTSKDYEGNTLRKIKYIADFQIGNLVIDIKGVETPVFKLKKELFKRTHMKELKIITKAPKWAEDYAIDGWIDFDKLKKLRRDRKKGKL